MQSDTQKTGAGSWEAGNSIQKGKENREKKKEGKKQLFIQHLLFVRHTFKCFHVFEPGGSRGHRRKKKIFVRYYKRIRLHSRFCLHIFILVYSLVLGR